MSLSELLIQTASTSESTLLGSEFYWKSTHGVHKLKATQDTAPPVDKVDKAWKALMVSCVPQEAQL